MSALIPALLAASVGTHASAIEPVDTSEFVKEITVERLREHLEQLQRVAAQHDNTRALGTKGYDASVRYVVNQLIAARYPVRLQPFTANVFEENSDPRFVRQTPDREVYTPNGQFFTMTYSGAGDVTAPLSLARRIQIPPPAEPSVESGCAASDFTNANRGTVVLVQRGTCTFEEKAVNAANAGALGVVIFNEGQPGRTEPVVGTLTNEQDIPVIGTSFAIGRELYRLVRNGEDVTVRLAVDAETTPTETYNVIAERRGRVSDQTVVVGAHLDSVPEGPGINDNGSGVAGLLVMAEQLNRLGIQPRNTVRFAFWGAEEAGLFGSNFYVANLSQAQLDRIALYLNFDMIGSPNFVRFVYDGDGSDGDAGGPPGSDVIEDVFVDFFDSRGLASNATAFDGRSDYFAFIQQGIPAGGLFSGAEGIKTEEQAEIYGGRPGRPYDACYHSFCDDISNLSNRALNQLGKAAAHAVLTFAQTREDIRRSDQRSAAATAAARAAEYRGPHLVR